MAIRSFAVSDGAPWPLGVTLDESGINVAVVSHNAERVYISLFDETETYRFQLPSRLGDVHFGFVSGVEAGQRYGLRAEGPYDQRAGHFFDPAKLLIDPYSTKIDRAFRLHRELSEFGVETSHLVPKCIVTSPDKQAAPLVDLRQPEFIYEISVKAFTMRHPGIPEEQRGTVAALAHPAIIEHLTKLSVDTVELMPLAAWIDERHLPALGLSNAWGYNPISFFAPDPRLAPGGFPEIRNAVSALHDAGIKVILDVVFNHTGESDRDGPTLSLRGIDHALYYRLAPDGTLVNDTGCGNTLALDRAPVVQLVLDSMRHWVKATGIDGFRYDLATVMGRHDKGFDVNAPLLTAIQQDPLLAPLIHIAEPWDIGPGGYRLGAFPAGWHEWNDHYRDDIRRFWRGDHHSAGALATRLAGSSDIFGSSHRRPSASINYLAAHDGFTLADSTRYTKKNNLANGENDRDGNSHEVSWKSTDPQTDIRALLATLFYSRGTPMLTAGDEFGRSQGGNNNAYAQDNGLTWLDWEGADQLLISFVSALVRLRRQFKEFFSDRFLTGSPLRETDHPDVLWLKISGEPLTADDWLQPDLSCLGLALSSETGRRRLVIWFNRSLTESSVHLPCVELGNAWSSVEGSVTFAGPDVLVPARSVHAFIEVPSPVRKHAGVDDKILDQLATLAGVQPEWWEVDGTFHRVSTESKRALLEAMSLPTSAIDEVKAAIRSLNNERCFPSVQAVKAGAKTRLVLDRQFTAPALRLSLGNGLQVLKQAGADHVQLPGLPTGIHDIKSENNPDFHLRLVVTPERCFLPPDIAEDKRYFGLSSHLYALRHPSDAGIGDFETLTRFCKASADLGGVLAGINPLHHLFPNDRERASPYQPSDRRFIDPIYISLEMLMRDQFLPSLPDPTVAAMAELRSRSHVDYTAVWTLKERLLRQAFAVFKSANTASEFERFVAIGGRALALHAEYESREFPQDQQFHMWLQWLCEKQMACAARKASEMGLSLGIYRDLALGCAYDGGEVWARPDLFATTVSLGAPPDPFAKDGQIWNLPPFIPQALNRNRFDPFLDILRANMRHAGVLRIDHILGYARQFWVPRGGSGGDGAYVSMPTNILIALTALASQDAHCMIIGEDLGTVPEGLRQQLAAAHILSYKMLWFEQNEKEFHPPATYPRLSAACLSSHDLKPFQGWRKSCDNAELDRLETAISKAGIGSGDLMTDTHLFIAQTPSALMLIQADDLTGETEPLNVPGTDRENPNWRRRVSLDVDELAASETARHVCSEVSKVRQRQPPLN